MQAVLSMYGCRTDPIGLYHDLVNSGRLSKQRQRVMDLLLDGLSHPCNELVRVASQYNARIFELRRLGFDIVSVRLGDFTWFQLRK